MAAPTCGSHDMSEHIDATPATTDTTNDATTSDVTTQDQRVDLGVPGAKNSSPHRRTVLRVGAVGVTGAAAIAARDLWVPSLARRGMLSADGAFAATSTALGDAVFFTEVFPTSPLILNPFTQPLIPPTALKPESF